MYKYKQYFYWYIQYVDSYKTITGLHKESRERRRPQRPELNNGFTKSTAKRTFRVQGNQPLDSFEFLDDSIDLMRITASPENKRVLEDSFSDGEDETEGEGDVTSS